MNVLTFVCVCLCVSVCASMSVCELNQLTSDGCSRPCVYVSGCSVNGTQMKVTQ